MPHGRRHRLPVLPGSGPLRRVVLAYGMFVLVEYSVWLVVLLVAFDVSGPGLASAVSVGQMIPAALLGPLLAGLADRIPRGRALALAHGAVAAGAGLTLVALLAGAAFPVVVACSGIATIMMATVRPAHYAALPGLAGHPEELVGANAWCSGVENVMIFAGPALAGVSMAVSGPSLAFGCATGLGTLACLLCARLGRGASRGASCGASRGDGAPGAADGVVRSEPFWREATGGLRALRSNRAALALLLVMSLHFVLLGALDVLGVAYATSLGLAESGAGLLIGGIGLGGLAGAVAAPLLGRRRSLAPVVVAAGVLLGGAFALVGSGGSLVAGVVGVAAAGTGGTVVLVGGRTLLQRTTDDVVLARVFAVQESAGLLGVALGAAVAPFLVRGFGAAVAFAPLGLLVVLLTLGAAAALRRLDAGSDLRTDELALLRQVPFLAVLPPYELERLARHAAWQQVPAGEVVVRQGEVGREFFVVAEGELAVDVDGLARPELRPGDGFGEIALLHAVPRTATVEALTHARLLSVRAEDFLAAVTGSPDGHRIAAEVAGTHLARTAG